MVNTDNRLASQLIDALIRVIDTGEHNGSLGQFLGVGHLTQDQIAALKNLSNEDKRRLIRSGHSLVNITINSRNIASICSLIDANNQRDRLIEDLIKAHASQAMMYKYFGLSVSDVAQLRRRYGITERGGRPAALTEQEEAKIYSLYKLERNRFHTSNDPNSMPRLYLLLFEQSGIEIVKIYRFIQSFNHV